MATLRACAAHEELRAARDARYRANVDCAVTQVRRISVLVIAVVALMSTHNGSLACSVGPVWGARDALLSPCAQTPAGAAGHEQAHTP